MIIKGTNLSMIRGDTESLTISCVNPDGTKEPLVTGDKVYFTVKASIDTEEILIQKIVTEFTDGIADITILPSDTKTLGFKTYYYDVQINKGTGEVTTIIPPSEFKVMGEVTYD
jgi:hypothetical protein